MHYGDLPPADAMQVEPGKFPVATTPGEGMSYETRRTQQNFPATLYVADNCAEYCDQARGLLSKHGISFSEKRLQTQEELNAFKELSGFDGVPALSVGKTFLKDFLAEQWHGKLDIAGYPKITPYQAPGTLPASAPAATSQVAPANHAAQ